MIITFLPGKYRAAWVLRVDPKRGSEWRFGVNAEAFLAKKGIFASALTRKQRWKADSVSTR